MVNVKRSKAEKQWRRRDFRIICDCQRHAPQRTMWRRALRIASRGAALLVGLPLAFAALDINSAMNLNVIGLDPNDLRAAQTSRASAANGALPMFTTKEVREQFLAPKEAPRSLTIDMFKESYFREHVPYGEIIFREARRNNLPPELVAAMVHTESDFRHKLVSRKSAQGLMQIVPSTARILGIRDPFDPQQNIAAGTKYFRYLLDRFDSETMALAAYNAGEGNVERFGGIPPFAETKNYIVKVNRRTDRYRQRVHSTYLATVRTQREIEQ
ncbi:MAG TPA: lytic transglycosylase domain-containing protein [Thermoanaerobaculia bacterium]|nr:lytic transglycosylase domain-containing protein [Thermoanaerobaculia bacterium]